MSVQAALLRGGAWLFLVGLLTGFWVAAVMTNTVVVPIPRLAVAAHLNALLGGLWCVAVGVTLPYLRYGDVGRRRLAILTAGASWGNWFLTLIASGLGVRGLTLGGSAANSVIAVLLVAVVVLPSLAAAAAWALGFTRTARS